MTNYLESTESVTFIEEDYIQYRSKILHTNIPENYKVHCRGNDPRYKKFTYIYQICWSIKFLRNGLIHILK